LAETAGVDVKDVFDAIRNVMPTPAAGQMNGQQPGGQNGQQMQGGQPGQTPGGQNGQQMQGGQPGQMPSGQPRH
jgi:hypothetical protein